MKKRLLLGLILCFTACLRAAPADTKEPVLKAAPGSEVRREADGSIMMTADGSSGVSSATVIYELNQSKPEPFTVSGESKAEQDAGPRSCFYAVALNFTYQDGTRTFMHHTVFPTGAHDWTKTQRSFQLQKPVRRAEVMFLYGKRTGKVWFRDLRLVPGMPKRPPTPAEIRTAWNAKLGKRTDFKRDYCMETVLVKNGRPAAAILGNAALAKSVMEAVRAKTGVTLPVIAEDDGRSNLITIGSRDRNAFVSDLYTRHYTLLDGKYPGKGGSEVRSLHNPFGDRRNFILCGGSDLAGDKAAVEKLVKKIKALPSGKELKLGFISDVTLSPQYQLPKTMFRAPVWAESPAYGNIGYFGWNVLAKNLAMLYITNDAKYAKEFLRLAFPKDKSVEKELFQLDDEAFHDRSKPIISCYHYRAVMMTLYWDLVEENPAFSDADRERVTHEFYRMMTESLTRRTYPDLYARYHSGKPARGDRHVSWEACNLFALGRYFAAHYPGVDSTEALRIAGNAFNPVLQHHLSDNSTLYFLASSVEPFQVYAALAMGDKAVGHPMLKEYVRSVTMINETALRGEHAYMLRNTPAVWLLQGAYFAQDEAPVRLLKTSKTNTDIFRFGQSWWPSKPYPYDSINANFGKWTVLAPSPLAIDYGPGPLFPREKMIRYLTFRWNENNFILADTMGGYNVREQPHQFAMFSARLRGVTLLRGHWNTLQFYANGQTQPVRRYYSEVLDYGSAGDYAWVTAKVASINGYDWVRTWLVRKDRFLLAADRVIPLQDCRTAEIQIQAVPFREDVRYQDPPMDQVNKITALPTGEFSVANPGGDYLVSCTAAVPGEITPSPWRRYGDHYGAAANYMAFSEYRTNVRKGEELRFVQLVRFGRPDGKPVTAMHGDTVSLRLPEPAQLKFTGKTGFTLVMPGETFTLKDGIGKLTASGKPGAQDLRRTLVREAAPEFKPVKPRWKLAGNFPASLLVKTGGVYIAAGKQQAVAFRADGRIMARFALPSWVRCAVYVPEKEMYLFGCMDEHLAAFDANGKELWRFKSVMHPGMMRVGDYHHKKAFPGVWSAAYAGGKIYAGSAGTIEVLTPDGKLLERRHPNIACQIQMLMPTDKRMLLSFGFQHWGKYTVLYGKAPSGKPQKLPDGQDLGQQGSFRYVTELADGNFAGVIIGKPHRVVVWDKNFVMTHSAALGEGDADAPVRLAVSGNRIAAATERKRGYVFDEQLKLLTEYRLPALPAAVDFHDGVPAFGLTDGRIFRSGAVIGTMPAKITGMQEGIVLDAAGNIVRY